jgi:hypothetical protein
MKGRGILKMASAFVLFVLYTTMVFAGDIMALNCGCCHDEADVHTAFRHIHKCCSEDCDNHSHNCSGDCDTSLLKERHDCHHNHSTEVKLYLQPRIDESSLRQTILLAILMDNLVEIASPENSLSFEYQECSLPALSAGYRGALSLRAPPAII